MEVNLKLFVEKSTRMKDFEMLFSEIYLHVLDGSSWYSLLGVPGGEKKENFWKDGTAKCTVEK